MIILDKTKQTTIWQAKAYTLQEKIILFGRPFFPFIKMENEPERAAQIITIYQTENPERKILQLELDSPELMPEIVRWLLIPVTVEQYQTALVEKKEKLPTYCKIQ